MPSMGDLIAASRAMGPAQAPAIDPMQLLDFAQRQSALDTQTKRAIPTDLLQYAMQLHQGNPAVGIPAQPDIANQLFQKMGITPPSVPGSGAPGSPLLPNPPTKLPPQNSPSTVDYQPGYTYGRSPVQADPTMSMTTQAENQAGYDAVTDPATGKVVDYTVHGSDTRAPWGFAPASKNPLETLAVGTTRPIDIGLKNLYAWLQGQPTQPQTTFIGH